MTEDKVWDWERGKRLHAIFCKGPNGEGCDIPLDDHPYPEWWVYAGYFVQSGDNHNIFVTFREEKDGEFVYPKAEPSTTHAP